MAKRRTLGSSDAEHTAQAKILVDEAWADLERMPPTCRGGIEMASRALAKAERAQESLWAVTDRAPNEELHALANGAAKHAHETVRFFANVCDAPNRAAADRPLFSRAKFKALLAKEAKRRARKK